MSIARIQVYNESISVKVPFRRRWVEELKVEVPQGYRYWDDGEKIWEIDIEFLDDVIDLCRRHFSEVEVVEEEEKPGKVSKTSGEASKWKATARLLQAEIEKLQSQLKKSPQPQSNPLNKIYSLMGKEELSALRRALAKKYHPDKSKGNQDKMKTINDIIDNMLKQMGGR